MPKFVDALGAITQTFAKALEGQQAALVSIAQSVSQSAIQPRTVSFRNIRRNDDGMLTGASATVQ